MKVYNTLATKDLTGYMLWVSEDSILYHDSEYTNAVTAAELEPMFIRGIYCVTEDGIIFANAFIPANDEALYATLVINFNNAYTAEYEPDPDVG